MSQEDGFYRVKKATDEAWKEEQIKEAAKEEERYIAEWTLLKANKYAELTVEEALNTFPSKTEAREIVEDRPRKILGLKSEILELEKKIAGANDRLNMLDPKRLEVEARDKLLRNSAGGIVN